MADRPEQTVFVVDDDEDVRRALRWLIESVHLQVETFESAEQFLGNYRPEQPGCLVLDVRMPGLGGLGLLEHLRSQRDALPVIMLTGHGDVPVAVRAMKAGALDFIEKPFTDQDLLDRIQLALKKDSQLRQEMEESAEIAERVASLTPRELEVLDRIVQGQANKVMSVELGISERTVETHRKNIMEKMRVRSVAELVQLALRCRPDPGKPGPQTGNS